MNIPDDVEVYEVRWSDGSSNQVFNSDVNKWNHVFASSGVQMLEVAMFGNRRGGARDLHITLKSQLVVQQPIKGLRLAGPENVGIHCYNVWEALLSSGSHLVCQWSINGDAEERLTTTITFTREFTMAGAYTLEILCHNDISIMSAAMNVTVSHSVTDLHLTIPDAAHGQLTTITITVYSGRHFTLLCEFGDGNSTELQSKNLHLVEAGRTMSPWHEIVPAYNVTLHHLYSDVGRYLLKVTVFNAISSLMRQKRVLVEDAIGSIVLYSSAKDVVDVKDIVQVTAVVAQGRNLHFDWDFGVGYSPTVFSEGNKSVATLVYDMVGEYEVTVKVKNHLQKEPVIARLPYSLSVQDEITMVKLQQLYSIGANFSRHNNLSDEVTFDVRSDGSPVTYVFDFGDGVTCEIEGNQVWMYSSIMTAQTTHKYDREGIFQVSVTAKNALVNVTAFLPHLLPVQVPVRGPLFNSTQLCTRFGDETNFTAVLNQGTNVTFTWKLDDETELVNTNATVSHKYREPGVVTVQVTASNNVSSVTNYILVEIVEAIQSVSLKVASLVIASGQSILYSAMVVPKHQGLSSRYYNWDFSKSTKQTVQPFAYNTYRWPGKNFVTVSAHNCKSSATSSPVMIHAVAPLVDLRIESNGDNLVGQPIKFLAVPYQGDSLNFTWDFGDGSPLVQTTHFDVKHTFNNIGEYIVVLLAENPLSNANKTLKIFILTRFCKPPMVSIVRSADKATEVVRQVRKWQTLWVESQVTVNCSITGDLIYSWQVFRINEDQGSFKPVNNIDPKLLHHPDLLLPPHSLSLGRYMLTLNVSIQGTEIPVYHMIETDISFVKTPLESIISGGLMRRVSRQSMLYLDGSRSRDPDEENVTLNYSWSCHCLENKQKTCFNLTSVGDTLLSMNESHLELPASWLWEDEKQFVFNLTVSISHVAPAYSTQVINVVASESVIGISLECKQCNKQWVNANDKLSVVARCVSFEKCSNVKLLYSWQLFLVPEILMDDGDGDHSSDAHSSCVAADGSTYHRLLLMVVNSTGSSANTGSRTTTTQLSPSTTSATTDSVLVQQTAQTKASEPSSTKDGFPMQAPWQQDLLEHPGPRTRPDASRRGQSSFPLDKVPSDLYPSPVEDTSNSQRNMPSGSLYATHDATKSTANDDVEVSRCNGDVSCSVYYFHVGSYAKSHVVSRQRFAVNLNPSNTFSDPTGPSLVLRPDTLTQGRTYLAQVIVSRADAPEVQGEALTYFRVNKSPGKGTCSVQPPSGIEMDTLFKVFCKEWRDKHLPVWYKVSYSLQGEGEGISSSLAHQRHVIYHGHSHEITFRLPAGLASNGHKVLLHLAIQDDWGAATSVCQIPIVVSPNVGNDSKFITNGGDIFDGLETLPTQLTNGVYKGDTSGVQDVHQVLSNWATRLNHLPSTTVNETLTHLAYQRTKIVSGLREFLIRDQVELIKTLRCLLYATQIVSQINGYTIIHGVKLLEFIGEKAESIRKYASPSGLSSDILALGVQIASNLIEAASHSLLIQDVGVNLRRDWTARLMHVVDKLTHLELNYHSMGEEPIHHTANFISVLASHYSSMTPVAINFSGVTFSLPHNMTPMMSSFANLTVKEECFQARVATFQKNPFALQSKQRPVVQSQVASLNLSTCDGKEHLPVQNLTVGNSVEIIIPLKTEVEIKPEFNILSRSFVNVHKFNMSDQQKGLYITFLVKLTPIDPGSRPFPITLFISRQFPPRPDTFMIRKDFPLVADELQIFMPPGVLKDSGIYYFGLVESSLNSGRRRKSEVVIRSYSLNAWFGSCLFWNVSLGEWSDHGCHIKETSNIHNAHCSCNHLTEFGIHFELIPNQLSFMAVENFFSPNENPLVLVLVGLVVLLYTTLLSLVCKNKAHDTAKHGLVYLTDNNITDSQLYEVVVDTGLYQTAPATAKISIILHGEYGMSETRELICEDGRPMFERNSRDRFLLSLPDSLGRIVKVQLWHNNGGSFPRWYLSQILIRDLNAGKAYYFLCQKWFAVDEGDGRVERELVALDNNNVGISLIFFIKGIQYLSEHHLWISVLTCRPHSRFTRAQRLTCCLTLLLSYMALNAVWHQHQPQQPRGEFGLLDVSLCSLAVGALCCVIVFPLHLFLAFLFRRSKVSYSSCERKADTSSKINAAPTTVSASGQAIGALGSTGTGDSTETSPSLMPYSSLLDQSILNWQSIQDWAQKQWLKRQQSTRSSTNSVKTNTQTSILPPAHPVQQTLHAGDETDQASSGFEDAISQATAERNRVKAVSESSSEGGCSLPGDQDAGNHYIFLPSWCRHVAWMLCALVCFVSAAVTIFYGFRFGLAKSTLWLQSLYFSFMACLFLGQPLWIIMTVLLMAIRYRNNPSVFDDQDEDGKMSDSLGAWYNRQKQALEGSEDTDELEQGVRARQRSRYLRFARPPQEKMLQESRKKLMKEKNAANFFRESVIFGFTFILVCVVAFGKDQSPHYLLNTALNKQFVGGLQSFSSIKNKADWYRWSQNSLLDAVYGSSSTSGLLLKDGLSRSDTVLISHPHLRQLRILPQSCPSMPYITRSAPCFFPYSSCGGDTDLFLSKYQWSPPLPGGSYTWGKFGIYDAGGFVVPLNFSSKNAARQQLEILESDGWLDGQTRVVIVELTVINIPTNLFGSVVLLLEFPATGGVFPSARIMSTYLFRYISKWDNCILTCELLFIMLALVRMQREIMVIFQQGCHYFSWAWNYPQLALSLVGLAYVACYIYRHVLVSYTVEFLRNTFYEQFISLAFLAGWDELIQSLVGMLVFLVVVTQGLQLTRYCSHLSKFATLYHRARREILLMAGLFGLYLAAFSSLGTTLFGSLTYSMRSISSSALTIAALSVGIYPSPDTDHLTSSWFCIFALFFTVFCSGFLTAYAVAVLTHRMRMHKHSDVLVLGKCELLNYCSLYLQIVLGIKKNVPAHEPEVILPPECTLAEFEYQVEELLFRMNALAGTTNLPEKSTGYLTDSDQSQAVDDDGISSGGSEQQQHQERCPELPAVKEGRLEQRVQKIQDKLYANEPYLAQLLKLDSIGADVLSQEKEKQLRSHLELEIFRRLQMRRQETGDTLVGIDLLNIKTSSDGTTSTPESKTCIGQKDGHTQSCKPHPDLTPPAEIVIGQASYSTSVSDSSCPASPDTKNLPTAEFPESSGDPERVVCYVEGPCSTDQTNISSKQSFKPELLALHKCKKDNVSRLQNINTKDVTNSKQGLTSKDQIVKLNAVHHKSIPLKSNPPKTNPLSQLGGKSCKGISVEKQKEVTIIGSDDSELNAKSVLDDNIQSHDKRIIVYKGGVPADKTLPEKNICQQDYSMSPPGTESAEINKHPATFGSSLGADYPSKTHRRNRSDLGGIPKLDGLSAENKHSVGDVLLSKMERADSLRICNKRPIHDVPVMERAGSLRIPSKKPELPPKPTFALSVLPSLEAGRSPRMLPLKIPAERILHKMDHGNGGGTFGWVGSGHLGESSSGSEPDAVHGMLHVGSGIGAGRRPQNQGHRNLRKTKSRGKGKGSGTLTPTLFLPELSFTVHDPPLGLEDEEEPTSPDHKEPRL